MASSQEIHPAVQGCIEVLERCEQVVEVVPESLFVKRDDSHESIGCHLRHGLEHVQCFLDGLQSGVIDYDARVRDKSLETSREGMALALRNAASALKQLNPQNLDEPLIVHQLAATRTAQIDTASSLSRELTFLSSHMIHHLSLINVYAREGGVELPANIGLAFSTAAYRNVAVG